MSEQARVESVDALKKFRVAFCKFAEAVAVSLDEAEAEIHRTRHWVQHEQRNYWKRQVQKRTELYARAKSALKRKQMMKTPLGGRYSCVEEERALAVAERRLEEAKEKIENVRRWQRLLEEESHSYQAVAQGLALAIQSDTPTALAQLDNMTAALEAYAVSTAPARQPSEAPSVTEPELPGREVRESMAREAPPASVAAAEAYQRLRARTPSQAVRDGATIIEPGPESPAPEPAGGAVGTTLAGLNLPRTPPAPDGKVVVARGVWDHRRVYLERLETEAAHDSGWYLGMVADVTVTAYDAVRVDDLLTIRPDLEAVLGLPAGYLVVLDGASLEAVLDPQGTLLWPSAEGGALPDRRSDAGRPGDVQ
jgi:hypothetical protein